MQAIIDGIESGQIKAKIVRVISDRTDALGLDRAKRSGITTDICLQKEDLPAMLQKMDLDYVCLAGWKQIIVDEVINKFPDRILNTHPGLIPDSLDGVVKNPDGSDALWNKGKMTNKAMQNFFDNKVTYAGCTNHFLSHEFDFGPVLGRCFEKIKPSDTIDSLYSRLKKKENKLYAKTLANLCK